MTRAPEVSVLVVTHRGQEMAAACLASVQASVGVSLETIVVDSGSGDGTADALRARFPDVEVEAMPSNVGFARAANTGARRASGAFLLLLNPDTEIPEHAIVALVRFARANPLYGVCGGRTLHADGSLDRWSCCGAPTLWSMACFATGLSSVLRHSAVFDPESLGRWRRDSARTVPVVTGCMALIRRDAWDRLGGFDERFFLYGEDVDLCLRAAALGHPCAVTPEATIVHHGGRSSATDGRRQTLIFRGRVTVMRKHWSRLKCSAGIALLLAGVALRAAASAAAPGASSAFWRDVWRARREWSRGYPQIAGDR